LNWRHGSSAARVVHFPKTTLEIEDRDIRLRALSHPLRLRILGMVPARPVSATDVAAVTGVAHAAASYHLRQLARAGLIRVQNPPVSGARARGRPQQKYTMRSGILRGLAPRSARLLERQLLNELDRKLRQAGAGTKRITDVEVWLAPQQARRIHTLTAELNAIVHSEALEPGAPRSQHFSLTSVLVEYTK
jgi:DNA-binding transcriptional ArsR family regulator